MNDRTRLLRHFIYALIYAYLLTKNLTAVATTLGTQGIAEAFSIIGVDKKVAQARLVQDIHNPSLFKLTINPDGGAITLPQQTIREALVIEIRKKHDLFHVQINEHLYLLPSNLFSDLPSEYDTENIRIIFAALYPLIMYKQRLVSIIRNKLATLLQTLALYEPVWPGLIYKIAELLPTPPYYNVEDTEFHKRWFIQHTEHNYGLAALASGKELKALMISNQLSSASRFITDYVIPATDILDAFALPSHIAETVIYSGNSVMALVAYKPWELVKQSFFTGHNVIEALDHANHLAPGIVKDFPLANITSAALEQIGMDGIVRDHHELGFIGTVIWEFYDKTHYLSQITRYAFGTAIIGVIPPSVHYIHSFRRIDKSETTDYINNKVVPD